MNEKTSEQTTKVEHDARAPDDAGGGSNTKARVVMVFLQRNRRFGNKWNQLSAQGDARPWLPASSWNRGWQDLTGDRCKGPLLGTIIGGLHGVNSTLMDFKVVNTIQFSATLRVRDKCPEHIDHV